MPLRRALLPLALLLLPLLAAEGAAATETLHRAQVLFTDSQPRAQDPEPEPSECNCTQWTLVRRGENAKDTTIQLEPCESTGGGKDVTERVTIPLVRGENGGGDAEKEEGCNCCQPGGNDVDEAEVCSASVPCVGPDIVCDPETKMCKAEPEEEEESHASGSLMTNCAIIILTIIIVISVLFDLGKEKLMEAISKNLQPVVTSMFAELTLLGFIGLIMFMVSFTNALSPLSTTLLGEGEAMNELIEKVHMIVFLVMVIFLTLVLLILKHATSLEADWLGWELTSLPTDIVQHVAAPYKNGAKTYRDHVSAATRFLAKYVWGEGYVKNRALYQARYVCLRWELLGKGVDLSLAHKLYGNKPLKSPPPSPQRAGQTVASAGADAGADEHKDGELTLALGTDTHVAQRAAVRLDNAIAELGELSGLAGGEAGVPQLAPGTPHETPYGTGKVRRFVPATSTYEIVLSNWHLAGDSEAVIFVPCSLVDDAWQRKHLQLHINMLSKMLASAREELQLEHSAHQQNHEKHLAEIAQLKQAQQHADANSGDGRKKSLMADTPSSAFEERSSLQMFELEARERKLGDTFDFADYLSIALGEAVTELVEIPVGSWIALEFIFLALYGVAKIISSSLGGGGAEHSGSDESGLGESGGDAPHSGGSDDGSEYYYLILLVTSWLLVAMLYVINSKLQQTLDQMVYRPLIFRGAELMRTIDNIANGKGEAQWHAGATSNVQTCYFGDAPMPVSRDGIHARKDGMSVVQPAPAPYNAESAPCATADEHAQQLLAMHCPAPVPVTPNDTVQRTAAGVGATRDDDMSRRLLDDTTHGVGGTAAEGHYAIYSEDQVVEVHIDKAWKLGKVLKCEHIAGSSVSYKIELLNTRHHDHDENMSYTQMQVRAESFEGPTAERGFRGQLISIEDEGERCVGRVTRVIFPESSQNDEYRNADPLYDVVYERPVDGGNFQLCERKRVSASELKAWDTVQLMPFGEEGEERMTTALRLMLVILSIFIAVFFVKFTPDLLVPSTRARNMFTQDSTTCWVLWFAGLYPIVHMFAFYPSTLRSLTMVSASLEPKSDTIRKVQNLHKTRRAFLALQLMAHMTMWLDDKRKKDASLLATQAPDTTGQDFLGENAAQISSKVKATIREVFALFDIGGEGDSLTQEEMEQYLQQANPNLHEDREGMAMILNHMDDDNSGEVEFEEFLDWVAEMEHTYGSTPQMHTKTRSVMFHMIDDDDSGFISLNELCAKMRQLREDFNPDDVQEVIMEVDDDRSGHLDFEEFEQLVDKVLGSWSLMDHTAPANASVEGFHGGGEVFPHC
eukprot:g1148.t1